MSHVEGAETADHAPAVTDASIIRRALEEILHSIPFRTSKQCQDMLRYVVEHSLKHERESLRERVIGAEVFSRSHDYDTSEDPVVRVRAADIRKRLAQYYQSANHGETRVRIEIPSGSYRALFLGVPYEEVPRGPEPEAAQPGSAPLLTVPLTVAPGQMVSGQSHVKKGVWIAVAFLAAILLALFCVRSLYPASSSALDLFWSPVLNNSKPVLIYTGTNAAYRFSSDFLDRYRKDHHLANRGPEFFVDLAPGQKINADDLIPVRNAFISTGDAQASADLVSLLTKDRRPFELRYGADIAVGDVHDSSTILIGAFNNSWTLDLTSPLRFTFKNGDRVEDTSGKTKGWSVVVLPNGDTQEDYAVISRLIYPQTGRVLITVAGVGSFGTQAAAEFLTNSHQMQELEQSAPTGWQRKNMQVVLHVSVRDEALDKVTVVATQYW